MYPQWLAWEAPVNPEACTPAPAGVDAKVSSGAAGTRDGRPQENGSLKKHNEQQASAQAGSNRSSQQPDETQGAAAEAANPVQDSPSAESRQPDDAQTAADVLADTSIASEQPDSQHGTSAEGSAADRASVEDLAAGGQDQARSIAEGSANATNPVAKHAAEKSSILTPALALKEEQQQHQQPAAADMPVTSHSGAEPDVEPADGSGKCLVDAAAGTGEQEQTGAATTPTPRNADAAQAADSHSASAQATDSVKQASDAAESGLSDKLPEDSSASGAAAQADAPVQDGVTLPAHLQQSTMKPAAIATPMQERPSGSQQPQPASALAAKPSEGLPSSRAPETSGKHDKEPKTPVPALAPVAKPTEVSPLSSSSSTASRAEPAESRGAALGGNTRIVTAGMDSQAAAAGVRNNSQAAADPLQALLCSPQPGAARPSSGLSRPLSSGQSKGQTPSPGSTAGVRPFAHLFC